MRQNFKDKRFTVMGLDADGRGLRDARYLLENGAEVIGTDLRQSVDLSEAVELAEIFSNFKLVLGEHRLKDFTDRDFIIRAALAPLDSSYLAHARAYGVPVVSDETLFLLNAPKIKTIGVTGTRGKTTVTHLMREILKAAKRRACIGGNVQGTALLPLLATVREGDTIVMELDSWKLQSFAENKISPEIAIFTTFFPDHLNYYKGDRERYWEDKTAIFKNQKAKDILIVSQQVADLMKKLNAETSTGKIIVAPKIPSDWQLKLLGEHNRDNASLALAAARVLGIRDEVSKGAIANFGGVPGRLEHLGNKGGVDYYNDTAATSPEGVMVALAALNRPGRIILLAGGADKGLDFGELVSLFGKNLKALVLFRGDASDKILRELETKNEKFGIISDIGSMEAAFKVAREIAKRGDTVLLSPGAASFGIFKNEYDRGDQFRKLVKTIEVGLQ